MKLGKMIFVIEFLVFFLLFFVLSFASVAGLVYPFAAAVMIALVWANQKIWLVAPAFFVASIAANFSFDSAIIAGCGVLVLSMFFCIHTAVKKRIKRWELFIILPICYAAKLVIELLAGQSVIVALCGLVLAQGTLLLAIKILEPLVVRGFAYNLTTLEVVSAGIMLVLFADGLLPLDIYGFSLLKLFAAFAILASSHVGRPTAGVVIGVLCGLGVLIGSLSPLYLAPFALWGLAASAFHQKLRILPVCALLASELVLCFALQVYPSFGILDIAPVFLGGIAFLALPKKVLNSLSSLFSSQDRLAAKSLLERSQETLRRRISNLAEVFVESSQAFHKLVKSQMSEEEVKDLLFSEIRADVCKNCPDRGHCHRTFAADTKQVFEELLTIAFTRGKITLLDLPSYLTSRCRQTSKLIGQVNTLTSQYKSYCKVTSNIDNSKLLICDQLDGVSQVMRALASEVQEGISFDSSREQKIIDQLSYAGIICVDAVVFEKDSKTFVVNLVVRDEDAGRAKIAEIVSSLCGHKMSVEQARPSGKSGLTTLSLTSSARFECIFGLASAPKSGSNISGDCHSAIRLDGNRFMFAICDGMGSGQEAMDKSNLTISLVENFYKAGFSSDTILSSVNRLLTIEQSDTFSTVDICVIDLKSGVADFVKMGSASSFVRDKDGLSAIEPSALPAGITQSAQPSIQKIVLSKSSFIVMCSDGITDSFESDFAFQDFLLSLKSQNPQDLADEILSRALAVNSGFAVDDVTVLVVKLIEVS